MSNTFGYILTFALGAAAGSAVAWKLLEAKYKKIADDEIASVKEVFTRKCNSDKKEKESTEEMTESESSDTEDDEYRNLVRPYVTGTGKTVERKTEEKDSGIYVITPEEFGEIDSYDRISLVYYSDDVLEYINGGLVEDVDGVVGRDSLTHFGEYEDDSVFVRNDVLKTDYEILLAFETYAESKQNKTQPIFSESEEE